MLHVASHVQDAFHEFSQLLDDYLEEHDQWISDYKVGPGWTGLDLLAVDDVFYFSLAPSFSNIPKCFSHFCQERLRIGLVIY